MCATRPQWHSSRAHRRVGSGLDKHNIRSTRAIIGSLRVAGDHAGRPITTVSRVRPRCYWRRSYRCAREDGCVGISCRQRHTAMDLILLRVRGNRRHETSAWELEPLQGSTLRDVRRPSSFQCAGRGGPFGRSGAMIGDLQTASTLGAKTEAFRHCRNASA